jgi:predicted AlkP superfamily phosphohydrolase/phosphomutase
MGPGYRTAKTLDPILRRLEGRPSTARKETYSRLRSVWDALPARLHRPLTRLKNEVRENIMAKDRARRRWFTLPVNHDGGLVRLNVVGREPQGIIQPGEEYEATLDYLIKELKAVIDLDTGEPVVKQVYRVQALAQGERRHLLPDLAVRWNATRTAKRIGSPSIGELSESISATRTGEHLPDGLLLSAAPGGHSAPDITMHAEDFAGTVAAALGVKLEGIEGDPVSGLLSPNRMSSEIK